MSQASISLGAAESVPPPRSDTQVSQGNMTTDISPDISKTDVTPSRPSSISNNNINVNNNVSEQITSIPKNSNLQLLSNAPGADMFPQAPQVRNLNVEFADLDNLAKTTRSTMNNLGTSTVAGNVQAGSGGQKPSELLMRMQADQDMMNNNTDNMNTGGSNNPNSNLSMYNLGMAVSRGSNNTTRGGGNASLNFAGNNEMRQGHNEILTVVLGNSRLITEDLRDFESLREIPEKVEYLRNHRKCCYLKLEEIFLRVVENLRRECDGYLEVLSEMQRLCVDPSGVRQLLHKKKRIYNISRDDFRKQPQYLLRELRERAFQDDFTTHVFVRTSQRCKLAENVSSILEEQLKGLTNKHETKVKQMREATLSSFEAFNTEVLMRKGEQHGLTTANRSLSFDLRKTQQALAEQISSYKTLEEKFLKEQGKTLQVECMNEQHRQQIERLEAKIWSIRREYENTPLKRREKDLKQQIEKLKQEKQDLATEAAELKSPQAYYQSRLDVEREVTRYFKTLVSDMLESTQGKEGKSVDQEVQQRDEYISVLEKQNDLLHKEMLSFRLVQERAATGAGVAAGASSAAGGGSSNTTDNIVAALNLGSTSPLSTAPLSQDQVGLDNALGLGMLLNQLKGMDSNFTSTLEQREQELMILRLKVEQEQSILTKAAQELDAARSKTKNQLERVKKGEKMLGIEGDHQLSSADDKDNSKSSDRKSQSAAVITQAQAAEPISSSSDPTTINNSKNNASTQQFKQQQPPQSQTDSPHDENEEEEEEEVVETDDDHDGGGQAQQGQNLHYPEERLKTPGDLLLNNIEKELQQIRMEKKRIAENTNSSNPNILDDKKLSNSNSLNNSSRRNAVTSSNLSNEIKSVLESYQNKDIQNSRRNAVSTSDQIRSALENSSEIQMMKKLLLESSSKKNLNSFVPSSRESRTSASPSTRNVKVANSLLTSASESESGLYSNRNSNSGSNHNDILSQTSSGYNSSSNSDNVNNNNSSNYLSVIKNKINRQLPQPVPQPQNSNKINLNSPSSRKMLRSLLEKDWSASGLGLNPALQGFDIANIQQEIGKQVQKGGKM